MATKNLEPLNLRVTGWSSWDIAGAVATYLQSAILQFIRLDLLGHPALQVTPEAPSAQGSSEAAVRVISGGVCRLPTVPRPFFNFEGHQPSELSKVGLWYVGRIGTKLYANDYGPQHCALFSAYLHDDTAYELLFRQRRRPQECIFWQPACLDETDPGKMRVVRSRTAQQWEANERAWPAPSDYLEVIRAFLPDAVPLSFIE